VDLFFNVGSIVECDEVCRFHLAHEVIFIMELLGVHEGFSFSCSKNKFSESEDFLALNNSTNSFNTHKVSSDKGFIYSWLGILAFNINLDLSVRYWEDSLSNFPNNEGIFDVVEIFFAFS